MEFKYFKLADKTIILGEVSGEDESTYQLHNAVELGVDNTALELYVEQRYYFKGMYCPFVKGNPIISNISKEKIVSVHDDLENDLREQYNKFCKEWFKQRVFRKPAEEASKEAIEELTAWLERTAISNNQIH